jgi:uncharacterized protein involved in exopolysaccharide biosynthesis
MLALVATIVAALAVAFVMPKKYVGQAVLIVDARDEQAIIPSRSSVSLSTRAAYVATQIELVQSGRVATQVARDLNLAQNAELREAWQDDTGGVGAIDVWIGNLLLQKLKVNNSASNLITVEYSSKVPKVAAQIANGFAKAYLERFSSCATSRCARPRSGSTSSSPGMRNQVTQAQNKLTAFQKQKGILAADERLDIESARLTELSTQMLAARTAFYDAQSKYKQASELVASGGSPDAMAEVMASPAIAAVKARPRARRKPAPDRERRSRAESPQLHEVFLRGEGAAREAHERDEEGGRHPEQRHAAGAEARAGAQGRGRRAAGAHHAG